MEKKLSIVQFIHISWMLLTKIVHKITICVHKHRFALAQHTEGNKQYMSHSL